MKLLDHTSLERSTVVANIRMNRERGAVGVNSYEKVLGLDPIAFLSDRLHAGRSVAWLDLCCGRGRALIDAAKAIPASLKTADQLALHGVDLVDFFDDVPPDCPFVRLESASLHQWSADRQYDLITCVHGLHYVGDKLAVIERSVDWLPPDGMFAASLDLANLRLADGKPLGAQITGSFHKAGLKFHNRRHLLTCVGARSVSLGYRFLGADDKAGPNYSGQEAVDSYYDSAIRTES